MRKWNLFILMLAAVSCSVQEIETPQAADFDLSVKAAVAPMGNSGSKTELLDSRSVITDKTLKLYAWENGVPFIAGEDVFYDGYWTMESNYKIRPGKNYSFLSYANMPAEGASVDVQDESDGTITYTVTDINTAQSDVLLGRGSANDPANGEVTVNYSHPYAALTFRLGNASEINRINSISLEGVFPRGSASLNQSSAQDMNGVMRYDWTYSGEPDGTLQLTGLDKAEGQDIATFVVIPQNLNEKNAIITVTYDEGNTMVKLLSDGRWDAGYSVTYTLNRICTIAVAVSGSNAVSYGSSKIFVRAAITGAWYDAAGNIIAPWTDSQGRFEDLPGNDWETAGRYYYYNLPLADNQSSSSLFESYTPGESPVQGAVLKLDFLVQAIPYNVNKTCREAFEAL